MQQKNAGSHVVASCMRLSRASTFCSRTVFRNLWGVPPLHQFRPPLAHPWFDFVTFLEDVGNKIAPDFKDSRATHVTKHTFRKKKKKKGFTNPLLIFNSSKAAQVHSPRSFITKNGIIFQESTNIITNNMQLYKII